MTTPNPIAIASDGYFHPKTEDELVQLVKWARMSGRQLRVRGAMHTFPAAAVLTDSPPGNDPREIDVMLDAYRAIHFIDEATGIVEVEAGCNLSVNPYDPTHTSTVENGLLYSLQQRGWALSDLGGITHQTVSGFLSTGSSGGSLKYGIDENIVALRIIDGTGEVRELTRATTPDLFLAAGVSMGLLGVISRVKFQCIPTYNIVGSESTSREDDCEIDLFGPGSTNKPSLEQFLRDTDYTRLMWWPQPNLKRVVVWKAHRIASQPGFVPKPYEEIAGNAEAQELLAGLLLSIIGNLDNLRALPSKIAPIYDQLDDTLIEQLRNLGLGSELTQALASILTALIELGLDGFFYFPGVELLGRLLKAHLGEILPAIYDQFVPLDATKNPPGPQQFQDYWWTGLPMDNGIDDLLMPTWFTEIWIPIGQTRAVMQALRNHFARGGLAATGTYAFEIYGTKTSPFWMSPASDGEGVVRVDVFWFGYNAGNPAVDFYPQFWELLRPFGFKLHWGKFLPNDPKPAKIWARYFSQQYKHWNDFLKLRRQCDPYNVFLTEYWREHLGLDDAPPLRARPQPVVKPNPFTTPAWASAERIIKVYSWLMLASVVYGIGAAHLPFIIGHPWTTCDGFESPTGCAVTFHVWEVPVVTYLATFGVMGLHRLRQRVQLYSALLDFTLALLAIFALFEILLILDSFQRGAPTWEIVALYSVCGMMLVGVGLGLYTRVKLTAAWVNERV
jgi:D-arabinono-1,4-lactone oxidase